MGVSPLFVNSGQVALHIDPEGNTVGVEQVGQVERRLRRARLAEIPRMVQQVYSHVVPADDQAAAQLVGDLCRRDVTNL